MNNGVEIVRNIERFYSLERDWEGLLLSSNQENLGYFNSWVWATSWWKVYAKKNDKLFVVCQWEKGRLIGLAPFYIKNKCFGLLKTLLFIGTGEPEDIEVATEYLDLLVSKESGNTFVNKVVAEIEGMTALANIEFVNLLDDSFCLTALVSKLNNKFILRERLCGYRYVADLKKGGETSSLPKSQIKKYHVSNRRFIRNGDANCFRISKEEDLAHGMATLSKLHKLRWESKGKTGVFEAVEFQRFHKLLSKSLLCNDDLLMFILSLNETPISVYYGWKFKDTISYYQSGIDTNTKPNMSPGLLMHVQAMQWGKTQGLAHYDFMKGGDTSYKSNYAEKTQSMYNVRLYKKSIRSYFFNISTYLLERIRGFKQ